MGNCSVIYYPYGSEGKAIILMMKTGFEGMHKHTENNVDGPR